jgi:Ser/Thr protein kinase RdoA (MazF antagonist)
MTTTVDRAAPRQTTEPAPAWMDEWPLAHPRPTGDWTASGRRGWARLDPELGSLRQVDPADDRKLPALARTLSRGELIGYRAGRRAVIATGDRFVKVVRPSRVSRLVAVHDALADVSGAPAVPRVAAATEDGAVDLTVVRGRSLHDLLRRGAGDAVLADAAGALAALHAIAPPAVLEHGTSDTAIRWIGVVGRAEPAAARSLVPLATSVDGAVASATDRRAGTGAVIVHADCHDKNLFLDADRPGFIDLDGARLGLREEDVSNLAVHVALRALQAGEQVGAALARRDTLVAAYRRSAPLDDLMLVALERAVWFRLACLYRFRSSSRPLVPTLLALAEPPTG